MNKNKKDNQQRGKFLVIEGSDSSGKHTQATLMTKHLQRSGIDIEQLSFPQYNTPFGELVAKYLRGEFGTLDSVTVEIPCLLYALDRFQIKESIQTGLQNGRWYLADRYSQSNLAHQSAKLEGSHRQELIAWIDSLESRLPQPDLVIYLNVPVEITMELMAKRKHKSYMGKEKTKDIHEQDIDYQKRVIETYLELAAARDNWVVIDCYDPKKNKIDSIEIIHHRIAKVVEQKLGVPSHH
jgi:dTMP kinase